MTRPEVVGKNTLPLYRNCFDMSIKCPTTRWNDNSQKKVKRYTWRNLLLMWSKRVEMNLNLLKPYLTGSIPRYPLRSHTLLCIENYLFIIVIWPILNEDLEFIYQSDCSDRKYVYSSPSEYTIQIKIYINVMQSALFLVIKMWRKVHCFWL